MVLKVLRKTNQSCSTWHRLFKSTPVWSATQTDVNRSATENVGASVSTDLGFSSTVQWSHQSTKIPVVLTGLTHPNRVEIIVLSYSVLFRTPLWSLFSRRKGRMKTNLENTAWEKRLEKLPQPRKEKGKESTLIPFICLKSFCKENSYWFLFFKFTGDMTGEN